MTNEKFTPGPWWNEDGVIHAKSKSWVENNHSCEHVARVYEDTDFNAEANGNLIAAAPEMYNVIVECESVTRLVWQILNAMTEDEQTKDRIRARRQLENVLDKIWMTIKKAKGEK